MIDRETRKSQVLAKFKELYGHEPEGWVRAPGRAELLGTDTDDHQGYVLTMSIHLDTWIAYRRSGSNSSRVHSLNLEESMEFRVGEEPSEPAASWDRYVSGVSRILQIHGYKPRGVEAVIHSTVPIGGGLSSSASLEVATALMLQAAGSFSVEPKQMAQICQQAENQCVGVQCGILDQYSSVFGKQGTAMLLDCRSLSHIEIKIPSDIRIVICDTNVPRTLAASGYAQRRKECDDATAILREQDPEIRTLRDVNTPMFDHLKDALPKVNQQRCKFVIEENQRVMDFTAAVVRNDREQMRRYCAASFAGLRDLYEKTVPVMEHMFEAMSSGPGVIAARQSGGGFGGCMVAYVLADQVEPFAAHVRRAYTEKSGVEPIVYVTEPSPGAGTMDIQ
ncbi:MAG: galactokinase [Spirochaetaceae bacterium]|nr:MAG: galactokinase [Spirochaetaceae bacterium]